MAVFKRKIITGLVLVIYIIQLFSVPGFALEFDSGLLGAKISEAVILKPGSDKMIKYGRLTKLTEGDDATAFYANEKLVVPLRFLSECFYGLIDYDGINNICEISFDRGVFKFSVGENTVSVNGEEKKFSVAPFMKNDRIYVRLKDFTDELGMGTYLLDNNLMIISPLDNLDKKFFGSDVRNELMKIFEGDEPEEKIIYVSTKGKAEADGSPENPVDSIYTAKALVREMKKDGIDRKYKVVFEGGTYFIDKTVVFEPEDSGTAKNPVEYVAAEGEAVKLMTGETLDNWQPYKDNIYRAKLSEKREDLWWVIENDEGGMKARYPNSGFVKAIGVSPKPAKNAFYYEELPDIEYKEDLQIGFFAGGEKGEWMWTFHYRPVTSFNKETKYIEFTEGAFGKVAAYVLGTGTQYIMLNALEFIDVPGEVYYDRANDYVYYYPRDPESINDVIIPAAIDIFEFRGESRDKPVTNITLKNIMFNGTDMAGEEFFRDLFVNNAMSQPNVTGNGVKLSYASGIEVDGCDFKNLAWHGIALGECANANVIKNSRFEHVGAGVLANVGAGKTKRFNQIKNCYIKNPGQIDYVFESIKMQGEDGLDMQYTYVGHNRFENIKRMGVYACSDLQWGTVIEFNDLINCMYESQDGASIYTGGSEGATIRNNLIHNMETKYGTMTALYMDDGTGNAKMYNNVVYRMNENYSHPHEYMAAVSEKSHNNQVYNNILANLNTGYGLTFNKQTWDTITGLMCRNNVFYNCYSRRDNTFRIYYTAYWNDYQYKYLGGNLFYNDVNSYIVSLPGITDIDGIRKSHKGDWGQKDLIGVKPEFMNEPEDDYRMKYDSIAYAQGFRDINVRDIGLTGEFKFRAEENPLSVIHIRAEGDFTDKATMLMASGAKRKILVSARGEDKGIPIEINKENLSFVSDNEAVATVSNDGVVSAHTKGKAKITASYEQDGITKSKDMYVFVDDFAISEYVRGDDGKSTEKLNIEVSDTSVSPIFLYGKSELGRIFALNTDKNTLAAEDGTIARINSRGEIGGKKPGETKIILTSRVPGAKVKPYVLPVNVVKNFYSTVAIDLQSPFINVGDKFDVNCEGITKQNEKEKIEITLYSDDESIVKTENTDGVHSIEGVGEGSTFVTVVYDRYMENKIEKKFFVNVAEKDNRYNGMKFMDIGTPSLDGGMKDVSGDKFTLYSAGNDVYGQIDEGTFLYKDVSSDSFEVVVTLESAQDINDVSTSVGPMIRIDTTPGSYNVHLRRRMDGLLLLTWRSPTAKDSNVKVAEGKYDFPLTVKLRRDGNLFTGYVLKDGQWTEAVSVEVEMPKNVVAGIAGFSHQKGITADFGLSGFSITDTGKTGGEKNEK